MSREKHKREAKILVEGLRNAIEYPWLYSIDDETGATLVRKEDLARILDLLLWVVASHEHLEDLLDKAVEQNITDLDMYLIEEIEKVLSK